MKLLHNITEITSSSGSTNRVGYNISNTIDYTNFKEWRSFDSSQQIITFNFTGTIDTFCIFGANFPSFKIQGVDKTLIKDTLLGTYRGYFTIDRTSSVVITFPVQSGISDYFSMSAIVIGNESLLENVVYPFGKKLANPTYRAVLESKQPVKKAKGQNYRLIELKREALDYGGLNDLSEIKQSVGKGNTFVIYVDDSNQGECYLGTRVEPFEYKEDFFAEDSLTLEETGGIAYNTRQLIIIDNGITFENYSTETLKYPASFPISYLGRVISSGTVQNTLAEDYSQQTTIYSTTIILDNLDGEIKKLDDSVDLRGRPLLRRVVDLDTDSTIYTNSFTIKKVKFNNAQAILSVESQDLALWHVRHPTLTFEEHFPEVTFPDGSNAVGQSIPYYFGFNFKVPCYYYSEYQTGLTSGSYIYIICQGELEEITAVYRNGALVNPADYTTYTAAPNGRVFHFIRFTSVQKDFATGLINITADIKGLKVDSGSFSVNAVKCFKWWLEVFVGVSVNDTSFATAAVIADTLSLNVGGGIYGEREAIDIKNDFLLACRSAKFWQGASGYEIEIPVYQPTTDADFTPDNMVIVSDERTETDSFVNKVRFKYRLDLPSSNYQLENIKDCGKSFGTEKEYKSSLVASHNTASKITQYLRNTVLYGDRTIVFKTKRDAEDLVDGNVIGLTHTDPPMDDARFRIRKITKNNNETVITCYSYTNLIFAIAADPAPSLPPSGGARTAQEQTTLIVRDGSENQGFAYLPTSENGDPKSKVHLWYDSGTNTIKGNT